MGQIIYHSPIGALCIESADGLELDSISFVEDLESAKDTTVTLSPLFRKVVKQLDTYFKGKLQAFNIPLHMDSTPFALNVWRALQEIPYGTTISYGELAERVDDPKATRAVGFANSNNPFAIIIPCHRVIGAQGQLVGYRWGLERKRWLLKHEQRYSGKAVDLSLF